MEAVAMLFERLPCERAAAAAELRARPEVLERAALARDLERLPAGLGAGHQQGEGVVGGHPGVLDEPAGAPELVAHGRDGELGADLGAEVLAVGELDLELERAGEIRDEILKIQKIR